MASFAHNKPNIDDCIIKMSEQYNFCRLVIKYLLIDKTTNVIKQVSPTKSIENPSKENVKVAPMQDNHCEAPNFRVSSYDTPYNSGLKYAIKHIEYKRFTNATVFANRLIAVEFLGNNGNKIIKHPIIGISISVFMDKKFSILLFCLLFYLFYLKYIVVICLSLCIKIYIIF